MQVKIVSGPYPPDTPRVILDHAAKLRAGAAFVPALVRKVARRYQDLMIQNALFKGKLQDLTVVIHPIDNDAHGNRSDGEFVAVPKGDRLCTEVHLSVNLADSPKFIAFVFAHELSHMLLNIQLDRCRIGDGSKEGCRPALSCVNRFLPPEPEVFGEGMEESIADALAMYVVSRCRFSDTAGTYAQQVSQWHHRQAFAHLLAAAFGDPLMNCKYIDEFTKTVVPEQYQEARVTEEGIEEDPQEFVRSEIRNVFWYCVVINQFHMIIDAYNDAMGKGAWRELCRHMDAVQYDIYYKGAVGEAAAEHQRLAETLLRDFAHRCAANLDDDQ